MAPEVITTSAAFDEATRLVCSSLEAADRARGHSRLAIPGGSVVPLVKMVREQLSVDVWKRLRLTWVDERAVPFADAASNRGDAWRRGALAQNDSPAVELALFLDGEAPGDAVARVTRGLAEQFDGGLDVALLGLGEDGHVASLFPGHKLLEETKPVAWLNDSPKPPATRITFTLPVLATAQLRLLLATGVGKKPALEKLVRGDVTVPAARVGSLTVVTDQRLTP